jgi:D-3-phosphoglycerate dehydrogenase
MRVQLSCVELYRKVGSLRVLITDPISEEGIRILEEAGLRVDRRTDLAAGQLEEVVRLYEVLLVRSRTKVTEGVISAAANLRVIGRAGAGLDNIDVEAARKRGVKVVNSPEASTNAVAELTIGLMIALARRLSLADASMKRGVWAKSELVGWELGGKTLGVIGFGRIGSRVAEIARTLGMRVLAPEGHGDRSLLNRVGVECVPLEVLLRRSDIVTIHVPLTAQTRHLLGSKELEMMKDGSYLVNTSRGAVVDEKALLGALKSGRILGAALDVFETEPPTNRELIAMPNLVCTPHIGGQTVEAQRMAAVVLSRKVIEALGLESRLQG